MMRVLPQGCLMFNRLKLFQSRWTNNEDVSPEVWLEGGMECTRNTSTSTDTASRQMATYLGADKVNTEDLDTCRGEIVDDSPLSWCTVHD
jgi:hypothetical protein